jgi:hypothetical protein
MPAGKDIRRSLRIPYAGPIRVSWEERGQPCFAIGKSVEVSRQGMRIEVLRPVLSGATVQLAAERIRFSGSAAVKHVTRRGAKYLLGLELSHPLADKTIAELAQPAVTVLIENLDKIDQKV